MCHSAKKLLNNIAGVWTQDTHLMTHFDEIKTAVQLDFDLNRDYTLILPV